MKKVAIVVPEQPTLMAIVGPYEILTKTNLILALEAGSVKSSPLFDVELVSDRRGTVRSAHGLTLGAATSLEDIETPDLVLIPSLGLDGLAGLDRNRQYIPWIQKQYEAGAAIASMCTGAFLLAATGILKDRAVTTHWYAEHAFRRMFPRVRLTIEQILVDEGLILSSGGAHLYVYLMLYLIEKYGGHELSVRASKIMLTDRPGTLSQAQFAIFRGQKEHDDPAILNAQEYVESKYNQSFQISDVAKAVALGERSFLRRFKAATGNTPVEYVQRVRVEAAKRLLEMGKYDTIEGISYKVGYKDIASFRKVFRKHVGTSPQAYRKKYGRMAPRQAVMLSY